MASLKVGDVVVVTAPNKQLRDFSCSLEIETGSVHRIVGVSGGDYMLDVRFGPYVKKGWAVLADPYADEDWV